MIEYKLIANCDRCGKLIVFETYNAKPLVPAFSEVVKKIRKNKGYLTGRAEYCIVFCQACREKEPVKGGQ